MCVKQVIILKSYLLQEEDISQEHRESLQGLNRKVYTDQPSSDFPVQELTHPKCILSSKDHLPLWTNLYSEVMALCLQWREVTAEGLSVIKLHPPSKLSAYATMETLLAASPRNGQACVRMSGALQGMGRLVETCDRKALAAIMDKLSSQVIILCVHVCKKFLSVAKMITGVPEE